ncbi:hypothetical protein BGX27_006056 [Mortierella sp. AM989]|nr:hypothetical protein BGX27_006056 [Mortierella sp. AM989]
MRSRTLPPASADAVHSPEEIITHSVQQQQQPRQFRLEENDNNVFISTSTSAPVRKTRSHSKRPSALDVTSSLVAPQLQEYLMQATQCAHDLQSRTQELESENRKLKELVRQHSTSALDWCSVAKQYQQDRNFMALRLAELELQISNTTHSTKDSIATSIKKNDVGDGSSSLNNFVSQTISQILDHMTPTGGSKEPKLPPLSKGIYSTRNENNFKGEVTTESVLRSVLKPTSKSLSCVCGCQEETRAWKTRCDFAENQITLLEMRCEKTNVMMDAYKAKWTQWKETVVREQYQRRMKAAMSPQSARYMSLGSKQSQQEQPQQQQRGQSRHRKAHYTRDNSRGARLGTEEGNSSQKRQEVTERNTIFNQLITGVLERKRSPTPGVRSSRTETSSVAGPHVVFDEKDDRLGSSDEASAKIERWKPKTYVLDSEENDTSVEYGEQPMSLTFPSDLALHRRGQGLSELDEDDDESDSHDSHGGEDQGFKASSKAKIKRRQYMDDSPTTRISERNQKRTTSVSRTETTPKQQTSTNLDFTRINAEALLSIASDRSSPPMFDTEDYVTFYRSAKTPVKQRSAVGNEQDSPVILHQIDHSHTPKSTSKNIQRNVSTVEALDHGRIFVPETPLELQGITPKKENQILTQSPMTTAVTHVNTAQHEGHLPNLERSTAVNGADMASQQNTQSQSPDGVDEPDKENKAPQEQLKDAHSNSDLDIHEKEIPQMEVGILQGHSGENNHAEQVLTDVPEQQIYNFTERRKDKRKQMHGHDCACCRRFYELTGPLPLPDGHSTFFTPAPRPGEKDIWEKSAEERLQDRIQQISRHRVQHEQPLTPPGFWDTDFPSTQDRLEWDKIAEERRERKKQRAEYKQQEQQQKRRR